MTPTLLGYWDDSEWPDEPRYMRVNGTRYPVGFKSYIVWKPNGKGPMSRHYFETHDADSSAWAQEFMKWVVAFKTVVFVDDNWLSPKLCRVEPRETTRVIKFDVLDDGEPIAIRYQK